MFLSYMHLISSKQDYKMLIYNIYCLLIFLLDRGTESVTLNTCKVWEGFRSSKLQYYYGILYIKQYIPCGFHMANTSYYVDCSGLSQQGILVCTKMEVQCSNISHFVLTDNYITKHKIVLL